MQHTAYTDPQQLTLPIKFAPSVVRAHGLSVAHPRPLVSYGKDYGRVFCFRTSPRKAWRYAEVEYAVGHSGAALAIRAGAPSPPRSRDLRHSSST